MSKTKQYTAGAQCGKGHVWIGVSNTSEDDAKQQARSAAANCSICQSEWNNS